MSWTHVPESSCREYLLIGGYWGVCWSRKGCVPSRVISSHPPHQRQPFLGIYSELVRAWSRGWLKSVNWLIQTKMEIWSLTWTRHVVLIYTSSVSFFNHYPPPFDFSFNQLCPRTQKSVPRMMKMARTLRNRKSRPRLRKHGKRTKNIFYLKTTCPWYIYSQTNLRTGGFRAH